MRSFRTYQLNDAARAYRHAEIYRFEAVRLTSKSNPDANERDWLARRADSNGSGTN